MKDLDFFLVAGYGWSGSSAVVDLLSEYISTGELGTEFRLIKDPYGINDLFYNMVTKADPLNYDTAIKDFMWYAKKLFNKPNRFLLETGLDYGNFFGKEFMYNTKNYIN